MKKILFISIIAILLANSIMASGSKENAVSGDQLERIKEKGEITIAMEGTWAPWTYHNEKDELVGYDTQNYFNLQFSKHVGMPPRKFRQSLHSLPEVEE